MKFHIKTAEAYGRSTIHAVHFGSIFNAPWVRGFYGENQWFYPLFRLLGMHWEEATFMAKTVTLHPHKGNVPLKENGKPQHLLSKYVYWNPLKQYMVNAFGLSNPGLLYCLPQWRNIRKPYVVSVISLKETPRERLREIEMIAEVLRVLAQESQSSFAVQFNAGCPNAGAHNSMDSLDIIHEIRDTAKKLRLCGMPIILNCSPVMPLDILLGVWERWDAILIGNTIPFGHPGICWKKVSSDGVSPLMQRGLHVPGGYSGPEATPLTTALIYNLRYNKVTIPIIAGNSVRSVKDIDAFHEAGANGIIMGSIALNTPWLMPKVIKYVQSLDWDTKKTAV